MSMDVFSLANLHLLFWLSPVPRSPMGENHFTAAPVAPTAACWSLPEPYFALRVSDCAAWQPIHNRDCIK